MAEPGLPASSVRLLLLGILGVSAALRLVALGTTPGFSGDEGRELYSARQLAEHGALSIHPVRPYFGPYLVCLTAPLLKLFGVLPGVARLVPAAAGVLATWLGWRLGRRWGGPVHGLAGAALIGLAPGLVAYSRVALSVAHIPVLTVLSWLLFVRLMQDGGPGSALGLGLALGAAVAFHPTGLLLVGAVGLACVLHPDGRRMVRSPRQLGWLALGAIATGWVAWDVVLGQLGLGPAIDLSLTHVDESAGRGLAARLLVSFPILLDVAAGGRVLEWLSGVPSAEQPLLGVLRVGLLGGLVLACVRAARERDPLAVGLVAGFLLSWFGVVLRGATFDLEANIARSRYLLVPVTLLYLLLPYGLVGLGGRPAGRRLAGGVSLVALCALLSLGGVEQGLLGPMRSTGGQGSASSLVSHPDAKLQAARAILDVLQEDEEGLLLAGDGWVYWAVLAFIGERMPADYVPDRTEACAELLQRTRLRHRFLVSYVQGPWLGATRACLQAAGYSADRPPLLVPTTPDGRPILVLWSLPPEPASDPPSAAGPGAAPPSQP